MLIRFAFWKLEIKRALQRVPQLFAGVVVLMLDRKSVVEGKSVN